MVSDIALEVIGSGKKEYLIVVVGLRIEEMRFIKKRKRNIKKKLEVTNPSKRVLL